MERHLPIRLWARAITIETRNCCCYYIKFKYLSYGFLTQDTISVISNCTWVTQQKYTYDIVPRNRQLNIRDCGQLSSIATFGQKGRKLLNFLKLCRQWQIYSNLNFHYSTEKETSSYSTCLERTDPISWSMRGGAAVRRVYKQKYRVAI